MDYHADRPGPAGKTGAATRAKSGTRRAPADAGRCLNCVFFSGGADGMALPPPAARRRGATGIKFAAGCGSRLSATAEALVPVSEIEPEFGSGVGPLDLNRYCCPGAVLVKKGIRDFQHPVLPPRRHHLR